MATIRLVPSTYAVSSTSYLSVSDASNMYTNTDSTTYATITNTYASTSSRYLYLRGFNFSSIPSGAVINSFTVKLKGYESGLSTSTSYAPRLANGTSTLSNTTASSNLGTSSKTITIPTGALTWENITNYGSNFTIMIYVRRSNKNTTGYAYIQGAEIEVDYTVPTSATVTSSLTGSGTINPNGATSTYEGADYTITITPTNKNETVLITNNGSDVSNNLVAHYEGNTITGLAQSYTTVLSSNNANFYTSSSTTGNYFNYAVNHSAESPASTSTSYNTYVKDGRNNTATGYAEYSFDFSDIPANAEISNVEVKCYGACESTTHDATHKAEVGLYSGTTLKSTVQNFSSTSNSIMTISDVGTWTRTELQNAKLRFTVAYYGGRLFGISWNVTYQTSGNPEYYTYTYTVTGDATIIVTIGSSKINNLKIGTSTPTKLYFGATEVSKIYQGTNLVYG